MKKLLLAFCVLLSLLGNAQTWTNYNTANTSSQLPNGRVYKIMQDIDGSMWFATNQGVSHFDGIIWKNYFQIDGLVANEVFDMTIDLNGNKWFFKTSLGVTKFDGQTWKTYNTKNELPENTVRCISIEPNGVIWFGTGGGVSRFDGKEWTIYDMNNGLVGNYINSITFDSKGNKWFATNEGVSKFNDTTWTSYTTEDGLVDNWVSQIMNLNGAIWVGTGTGVSKFDGQRWKSFNSNNGLVGDYVTNLAVDLKGNIWVSTDKGVSKYNDTIWTSYTSAKGLVYNSVGSIAIDSKGNKWFGAGGINNTGGVSKYNDTTWTNFTVENGLKNNSISYMMIDKEGNKWFATSDNYKSYNVSKFDDSTWTHYSRLGGISSYPLLDGYNSNEMYSVEIDKKGNKWFTGVCGVTKYDDTTWTVYNSSNSGLPINNVVCMAIDLYDNKWFGTYNGISKFDGKTWINYSDASGTPLKYVRKIVVDLKGDIWVSTQFDGTFKFDGNTWTNLSSNYGAIIGLDAIGNIWFLKGNDRLLKFNGIGWEQYPFLYPIEFYTFAADKEGNSWFAGRGIYKFDGKKFLNYSNSNCLYSSKIYSLAVDAKDNLWIGTSSTITKFDGTNCTKYIDSFDIATHGNIPNDLVSMAIDVNGNKWFGTRFGVYKFSDSSSGPVMFDKIQKGYVFFDLNNNGKKDPNETNISGQIVKVDNNYTTTQNNGLFYTSLNKGTYTYTYRPQANWKLTTDSSITVTVTDAPIKDTLYFGLQAIGNKHEVETKLTGTATRAGFESKSWINYTNLGTLAENGTVSYTLADEASLLQTIPVADSIIGKRLVWKYNNLIPNEQRQISITTQMPGVNYLGDTLVSIAKIKSAFTENSDTLKQVLTGSYDPNDKLVAQGIGSKGYVLFGKELEYTVRFQNTGTDTAFNVNIRDTLDLNLDVASLQIVASSHPVKLDLRGQNEATFRFENILLPHQKRDDLGSNGFVKYAIRPKKNLPENTLVKNKAHIYFDFNPAIITNETVNTYVSKLPSVVTGIQGFQSNKSATVFPNPAKDEFTIVFPQSGTYEVSLANIQGKNIKTWNEIVGQETTLSLDGLEPGLYLYTAQSRNGQKYMGKLVIGR